MQDEVFHRMRLVVVDDDAAVTRLLGRILRRAGYTNVYSTADPNEVIERCANDEVDLAVLDLHMPGIDGFTILERIREHAPRDAYLPVLVVTGDISPSARQRALSGGAKDFLTKPFDTPEVLLRVRNLLETRHIHLQLMRQNELLEETVRQRTQELDEARIEILERLAKAAEYRDDGTRRHTERVGIYAARLARALKLDEEVIQTIRRAAPLHDLGKIGIPDHILLKPGELTDEEAAIMRTHTTIGAEILSGSRVPTLGMAAEIALCHHERWDGTGYPRGLAGDAIPLAARIVAVADFYDALAHDRPYRRAWPLTEIIAELRNQAGRQFDPHVVEAFLTLLEHERALAPTG
ncbi:MAG TPA: HD domain-containing phosphohydrolase [Longimicrobiales bacterium]